MKIAVLNVGNAAATVLGEDDDTPRVLLDGGRRRNAADLSWYLTTPSPNQRTRPNIHNIQRLVVSHFDIDHWGGLSALGRRHSPSGQGAPLIINYPKMPEEAQTVPAALLFLRYLNGDLPAPFTADTLASDWRPGRSVKPKGLRRNNRVLLVGKRFRVLWPPPVLPQGRAVGLTEALDKVREVARKDPYFGNLFDELHGNPLGPEADDVEDWVDEWQDNSDEDTWAASDEAESVDPLETDAVFRKLPKGLLAPARVIHKWNNDLSLVLAAEDQSFLAMGDVSSKWAIDGALRGAAAHYEYMLAPHHGTHADQNLPSAGECFMQTGHRHSLKSQLHVAAHAHANHVCTHTDPKPGTSVRGHAVCGKQGCVHNVDGGFFRR